ncbi:MAG TPA: heat-inducible transcriptional repressor HrcA [Thermoanaerobaculia bacterium]|jgi:heat-inducible transcriptional repressor|nr:heat-inducible transcriptional repressor HrcA [Thermoanaerobaculia bacterium]
MPEVRDQGGLSARDREILKDVILTYILNAEPVSSRSVAKHNFGLSAATIRNVMADLEEWGYLMQPHTSAGRVPTAAAYHLFIQSMMEARAVPAKERRYIQDHLKGKAADADQLLGTASHLLSELSSQVGIVVAPAIGETVLKAVDFVPIAGRKILCVVVSATGFIDNKVIETEEEISREELTRISNYVTENFAGRTLGEIRERLLRLMVEEKAQMDRVLARTIELAQAGLAGGGAPGVVVDGTSMLLAKPELADLARVRRMIEAFADKARLVRILNRCIQGGGVRVLIGEDCDLTSELEFSVVAAPYGHGERPLGTLGIVGPSRMDYSTVIPLVHFLGETLSRALADAFSGEPERRPERR